MYFKSNISWKKNLHAAIVVNLYSLLYHSSKNTDIDYTLLCKNRLQKSDLENINNLVMSCIK